MRLEGFLSLDGSPSKTYQYFCVYSADVVATELTFSVLRCTDINKHLMSACDLHRVIECKFARSSFAKHVRVLYVPYGPSLTFVIDRPTTTKVKPANRDPVRSHRIVSRA